MQQESLGLGYGVGWEWERGDRSSKDGRMVKIYKIGLVKDLVLRLHLGSYPVVPRAVPSQRHATWARDC